MLPKVVGNYDIKGFTEVLHYQYLPVRLSCTHTIKLEPRLEFLRDFIVVCMLDFMDGSYVDDYYDSNIYLTVKRQYQKPNCGFNRSGWHIDGYGTGDTNYIWFSNQSTIFNPGPFNLSLDHDLSIKEMEEQVDESKNVTYPNKTLLRLDNKCVHRVGDIEPGLRTFIKISVSKHKYNLFGNSHNYELNYNWEMHERKESRNHPTC